MGGMGLDNMRQRMVEIGGRLDITSAPGQGTCIRAGVHLARP
jgi:signal transduction histidine kinase